MWYEHVTGEPLQGLTLAEQWERVDVIARRFRAYSDGRAEASTVRRRSECRMQNANAECKRGLEGKAAK